MDSGESGLYSVLRMIFIFLVLLFPMAVILLPILMRRFFLRGRRVAFAVTALIWIVLTIGVLRVTYAFLPGKNVVLDRVTTTEGVELALTHRSNGSLGEPYTISFYYRKPGERWGWFYYEHEDTRWWDGQIELNEDESLATIMRGTKPVATFDISNSAFTILGWDRTITGAQQWMPENWSPEEETRRANPDVARSPQEVGG